MTDDLDIFKDNDVYSLAMFLLYKLIDDPKYSTLSELVYILDKKNLLELCQYFGGLTIKIPTLEEIRSMLSLLMLYERVNIEGMPYDEAVKKSEYELSNTLKTKEIYSQICSIMKEYDIKARRSIED